MLCVPFSPPRHRAFCGPVLRESTDWGNPAIVIWKSWVALSPVGDRLAGARSGCRCGLKAKRSNTIV